MAKKNKITQGGQASKSVIQLSQVQRFHVDIADYITAIRSAENVDWPIRARLYDLYTNALQDTHLSSVIQKRKATLTSSPIKFMNKNGEFDETINEIIASPWFLRFVESCLDARFWGFSLFQFDKEKDGFLTCETINRKHVDPLKRVILKNQFDQDGEPFDNFYNLLLIGEGRDLGLLAKAVPWVIYKTNAVGDWSQFSELFGMPIREYTYDTADEDARQRLLNDANEQGAASVYIHPNDSSLKFIEAGGKSASSEVYSSLINRCNAEISKLVLGNTLTTEAGETGTQALGTVQAKGEDLIKQSDRTFILNILNYDVTDMFLSLGIDTRNGKFIFEETEDVDVEKQMRIVQGLHQMGLPIPDDYLYEKFGIDKPEEGKSIQKSEPQPAEPTPPKTEPKQDSEPQKKEEEDKNGKNRFSFLSNLFGGWRRFFV